MRLFFRFAVSFFFLWQIANARNLAVRDVVARRRLGDLDSSSGQGFSGGGGVDGGGSGGLSAGDWERRPRSSPSRLVTSTMSRIFSYVGVWFGPRLVVGCVWLGGAGRLAWLSMCCLALHCATLGSVAFFSVAQRHFCVDERASHELLMVMLPTGASSVHAWLYVCRKVANRSRSVHGAEQTSPQERKDKLTYVQSGFGFRGVARFPVCQRSFAV